MGRAIALSELNTAVNHRDHATQQNAAMIEEMNAAAAGLAQAAHSLTDLRRGFKTGEDKARTAPRTVAAAAA